MGEQTNAYRMPEGKKRRRNERVKRDRDGEGEDRGGVWRRQRQRRGHPTRPEEKLEEWKRVG